MPTISLTRRQFLLAAACCATFPISAKAALWDRKPVISGSIIGASHKIGHKLRSGGFPPPTETIEKDIVIVGGGIAGLSAAWKLQKSGVSDFLLLELEQDVGGNASSGENAVSAYPWGAHYVPLLTQEAKAAQELFTDLGIITGRKDSLPIYNDYYLCSDPHERLYMYGRWHEGLVPQFGISARDQEQYRAFFGAMDHFKILHGADGRKAFSIPMELSSHDPAMLKLDKITMAEYLKQQGWDSPYLSWYVNYCCRDDYGATSDQISAWAGIHYFAARTGQAANADSQTVITWPEGNGWIVKQLKQRLNNNLHTNALVYSVKEGDKGVEVSYLDIIQNKTVLVKAKTAILATPRFVADKLTATNSDLNDFHYSPWAVANITLDMLPCGQGVPMSWDNMIFDSQLLGYVDATHQNLNIQRHQTVLTYYWPLSHLPPKQAREEALARPYTKWRDMILKELLKVHPELDGHVKNLDVCLWGHGMISPQPDFIWGHARKRALTIQPPIFYAHSDMSGISIFEEANYHGVNAAQHVMSYLHHPHTSSL